MDEANTPARTLLPIVHKRRRSMVTPGKFVLALLAGIAMLVVIGLMVVLPDTGHYANIAH
jgi:hypothetical protein